MVRIHLIVMIRWTGLAPWKFEFPFPGSLTSTFLVSILMLQRETVKRQRFAEGNIGMVNQPLHIAGVWITVRVRADGSSFFITLKPEDEGPNSRWGLLTQFYA